MSSPDFLKAADDVKKLVKKPSDTEMLEVYSFYKQATVGDINTDRPGFTDFAGKAKWDEWSKRKGLSKADAEQQYVAVVKRLIDTYGLQ